MFGLIKGCHLNKKQKNHWMAHFCGLCLTLKQEHGHMARMATNGDGALLSIIYEAQSFEKIEKVGYNCPLRSFRNFELIRPDYLGLKYAAAISVLMGASKIFDNIQDRDKGLHYFPGFFKSLAHKWQSGAEKSAGSLGFEIQKIKEQNIRQARLESQTNRDFLFYSQATEMAAGAACAHTAIIAKMPHNYDSLFHMGRMFGRIIYLIDSYRDYSFDLINKNFNALAKAFPLYRWHDIQKQAKLLFKHAHKSLSRSFEELDLLNPDPAKYLFIHQIWKTGKQTMLKPPDFDEDNSYFAKFKKCTGKCSPKKWCDGCDCCCDCCDGPDNCACEGCDCCGCDC